MLGALIAVVAFAYRDMARDYLISDLSMAYLLPVMALLVFAYLQLKGCRYVNLFRQDIAVVLLVMLSVVVLLSVDVRHLLSLFDQELAYPKAKYHQLPLVTQGWLGGDLNLPGWHLQLRSGLLYSGVVAIPLSLLLAILNP